MGQRDSGVANIRIVDRPTEEAVEAVANADESVDPETARSLIHSISRDGVVTEDALRDELADVSTVVSTPETRLELASMAFTDVTEAAQPFSDVDIVEFRLTKFQSRLTDIEDQLAEVIENLQSLLGADSEFDGTFGTLRKINRIRTAANDVQEAADALAMDIESFETWLTDPVVRLDDIKEDIDAIEDDIAALEQTVQTTLKSTDDIDSGFTWTAAIVDHRTTGLVLADARSELADVVELADRRDSDLAGRADELDNRLDELELRRSHIGEKLESISRPEYHERFGDRITTVESIVESHHPPIDWQAVQADLDGILESLDRTE